MPRHIRKGDNVIVTAGNDRGVVGQILRVIVGEGTSGDRVVVQGVNMRTKHMKPTQTRQQGGIIRRESPIHSSNVSPVVDGKPTRVRFATKDDGTKVRLAVRGGSELHTLRAAPTAPKKAASKSPASKAAPKAASKSAQGADKKPASTKK